MLPTRANVCGTSAAIAADSKPAASRDDELLQSRIRRLVAQQFEHGDSRGRGQRIAAERAGLKHFAGRKHVVHDVGPAAVRPDRQTAADDLSQRRQIGPNAEQLLRPAISHAEAGDHFVENQQRPVVLGQPPGGLQKFEPRHDDAHIPGDRFQNHRGDSAGVTIERRRQARPDRCTGAPACRGRSLR